jgi:L-asparaginase
MEPIRILVTGGTFDKEYNELTGELFFQKTHAGDMLKLGRCLLEVEIETLMMIDSLQMTDTDRQFILDRCAVVPEQRWSLTPSEVRTACSIWAPRSPSCRPWVRASTWR